MSSIGSYGGGAVSLAPLYTTGKVENATVALADTEQSHTFPANTKKFEIRPRGNGIIKLTFDSGTSGTIYRTIHAGSFYSADNLATPSLTIYFQSATAGLIVELTSWS